MSDETETTQSESPAVKQSEEPKAVDLAEAAAKAATKQERSIPKPDPEDFTPEQLKKLDAMFKAREESASSRAVNQFKEKIEKSGEYLPRDEFDSRLAEALTAERERSATEAKARDSFNKELGRLGITPDSEKYMKVAKAYTKLESEGAVTPRALLSADGVRALAFAAGVIDSEVAAGPQRGFDTSYRIEVGRPRAKDAPATTEDIMFDAINKAMGH